MTKTTSYKVVLPFYGFAAVSFFVATLFLLFNAAAFKGHYFQPHILAITHLMALGWGVMIILGASHQLVPVLMESGLYSAKLASLSFVLASLGIPLLVYGFYVFDMGRPAQWGAGMVNGAIVAYLINLWGSISRSKTDNIQAVFIFTAGLWLLVTSVIGLLLVCNFSSLLLPEGSLHYLPVHAHTGIIGWFILMVVGVGSRLIPMFLISKYTNRRLLWWIYGLINLGLVGFIYLFLRTENTTSLSFAGLAVATGMLLFGYYCYRSFQSRIRKKVDHQMRISLLSVAMLVLPLISITAVLFKSLHLATVDSQLVLTYGFVTFFGWITAIVLGMTFKTLPFIVWNKVYHQRAGMGKTPNPKDLFSQPLFNGMGVAYLAGFLLFVAGILGGWTGLLQLGAFLLLSAAILYGWNVAKILLHKPMLS